MQDLAAHESGANQLLVALRRGVVVNEARLRPPVTRPGGGIGRRVLVTAVLAIIVFAVLSAASDMNALGQSLRAYDLRTFWWALGLVAVNYALRFWRWELYLRALDVRVPTLRSLLVFLSGFVMSVTPGKMGEVFKSVLLYEYRAIPIERTASIVIAERALDLVGLVAWVAIGSTAFEHGLIITIAGCVVVLAIILGCTVRPLADFVLDVLERFKPLAKLVPKLRETQQAVYVLMHPRLFASGTLLAFMGWGLEGLATYEVLSGFAETHVSLLAAVFSYSAGTLAGALAMLPGGLGVAELGMSALLRATASEITVATATAATILVRLATLWFGVAVGGIALALLRTVGRRLPE
jgi:uncharacterized protein (TIRG00374 family)